MAVKWRTQLGHDLKAITNVASIVIMNSSLQVLSSQITELWYGGYKTTKIQNLKKYRTANNYWLYYLHMMITAS